MSRRRDKVKSPRRVPEALRINRRARGGVRYLLEVKQIERITMAKPDYLAITITYTNGVQDKFFAQSFDIDPEEAIGSGRRNVPFKFVYTGISGEDVAIYLTLAELSGITLEENWQ
jgi:hypothetical protein